MSRTFVAATPENMFEDFEDATFFHEASERHYEMYERDGKYYVRRYMLDAEGERFAELEQQIEWIIGSGAHSRTYLYTTPAGEVYQFPVAWQTAIDDWEMHGGFPERFHGGFRRQIQRQCMGCHNRYLAMEDGHDEFGHPHLYPLDDFDQGIGCQRCHGPGAEHVRLARDHTISTEDVVAAIVNVPRMSRQQIEDTCRACHMQPASRIPSRVNRFGRGAYEFSAGDDLAEHVFFMAFGDEAAQLERFDANHHPFRLEKSVCYIESDGAMTCLTCHDPHHNPPPVERKAHYNGTCMTCHVMDDCDLESMTADVAEKYPPVAHVEATDCVSCHMPKRRAQDLVHEIVTDHYIRREPPTEDLTAMMAELPPKVDQPVTLWPDRAPPEAEEQAQLATTAVEVLQSTEATNRLLDVIEQYQPEDPRPWTYLGFAYQSANRHQEAIVAVTRALEYAPDAPMLHYELGTSQLALGDLDGAEASFRRMLELRPNVPEGHYGLGLVMVRRGQAESAVTALREAVRLRPHYLDALDELANLYAGMRRLDDAVAVYEQQLAWEPARLASWRMLGIGRTFQQRHAEALRTFERGLVVDPTDPGLAVGRAMSLHFNGRSDEAAEAARAARSLPEADVVACDLVIALTEHARGRITEARRLLMQARQAMSAAGSQPSVLQQLLFSSAMRSIGAG